MHREDIKAQLRKKGSSLADVGRSLGVSGQAVSQTLQGFCRSRRIERKIAEILELPLHVLWPERYPATKPE